MKLDPIQEKFILHWGEMGTRWGINRTLAQIHALLFLAPRPLHAEEICETLELARSNVSTALKELQGWNIIRLVHVRGDKRDHFESLQDVWETFRIVLEERKKREIDPTISVLRDCLARLDETDAHSGKRLRELHDFFQLTTDWYTRLIGLPSTVLVKLMQAREKIIRPFTGGKK
jgi:DNA-binding transcriptional regulator GbsR (MarR family)